MRDIRKTDIAAFHRYAFKFGHDVKRDRGGCYRNLRTVFAEEAWYSALQWERTRRKRNAV